MRGPLGEVFARARAEDRTALIGYLPSGFPDPESFLDSARWAARSGMDVLELGVPTDSASLDGPVIQDALRRQAEQGIDVERALELAGRAREVASVPVIAMAYAPTLERYGDETFLRMCLEGGLDGILVPDLAVEQLAPFCQRARGLGLTPACFVGDPGDATMIAEVRRAEPAFVYMRSLDGTTGEAMDVAVAQENLQGLRGALEPDALPVVVGFGIKGGVEAAALASAGADGVVVGTSLVEAASSGARAVQALVLSLSRGARSRGERVG